jgi:hypothetical protein
MGYDGRVRLVGRTPWQARYQESGRAQSALDLLAADVDVGDGPAVGEQTTPGLASLNWSGGAFPPRSTISAWWLVRGMPDELVAPAA